MPMSHADPDQHQKHVMRLCRAAMPGVAGVVLADEQGGVLGHEAKVRGSRALAREALTQRRAAQMLDASAGASALVRRESGLFLVVFVPPALAQEWHLTAQAPPTMVPA